MFYENEFSLLCDTLKKRRIQVNVATADSTLLSLLDDSIRSLLSLESIQDFTMQSLLSSYAPKTLYHFKDFLTFSYITFLLPNVDGRAVFIGPYLSKPMSRNQVLEICEQNGFSPKNQKVLDEYFSSVPVLSDNSDLFLLIDAFCEHMWDGPFSVADIQNTPSVPTPISSSLGEIKDFDDTFFNMKNMERRYQMENEIMDAVMLGSEHKINQIFSSFTDNFFEMRMNDPLRNSKNYCVIMNTLLRKAAERGGVHPVYLDKISSKFALEIERIPSVDLVKNLMTDMFRSYCRLVSKHSSKDYSPIVQKAVVAIDADPSVELNLHMLAEKLNVSNVYLSSVFKKETGKTVTEYIRERRLAYAKYLLENTNLQIQTVALHCGMMDIHYFSKQFKRHTGKTPTAYRAEYAGKKAGR